MPDPTNPLTVLTDKSMLLETGHPLYPEVRDAICGFAELVKSPDMVHFYEITPLSLWNAAALGADPDEILDVLERFGKYPVPRTVADEVSTSMGRYGLAKLEKDELDRLVLRVKNKAMARELWNHREVRACLLDRIDETTFTVRPDNRGLVKQAMVIAGYPAQDLAGYLEGESFQLRFREKIGNGNSFSLRPYQQKAIDKFWQDGSILGGNGVVVLPCGSGKTIVGMGIMEEAGTSTLIICPNIVAARQWKTELMDKTNVSDEDIGEYSGEIKEIRPITIATYQILIYRKKGTLGTPRGQEEEWVYPHFGLFNLRNWGLIIYDEVHLLPAPVFKVTAELQARRRLGLTATLVREDGREKQVFSLIGPKRFEAPWKELEKQQWIATALCHEVRVEMDEEYRMDYAVTSKRGKYRMASENPRKLELVKNLLEHHKGEKILVIGQYLDQLRMVARALDAELLTGQTPTKIRQELYDRFRDNGPDGLDLLVVSKVANFAIDLPDANVAIQLSGAFGSRQEEAQRLGRILRPKKNKKPAHFYTLVSNDTVDQDFNSKRQRFLTERGYGYEILDELDLLDMIENPEKYKQCESKK